MNGGKRNEETKRITKQNNKKDESESKILEKEKD